jgi:D-glycero-D-manno-heptose 1,7-bisphosphate phosphatase
MEIRKAVFLDKDGTLIRDIPYNVNPDLITLSADCISGLKKMMLAGYQLIVISNQSGVAMDFFDIRDLLPVEKRIDMLLRKHGIYLSGFYFCPHHPQGLVKEFCVRCDCRKPKNGLLLAAANEHRIDLSKSWMLGDILDDIEAGNRSGCKTVLIDNGNETEWKMNPKRVPDFIAAHINQAADYILEVTSYDKIA